MTGLTRPATRAELAWVAPAAARAHVVADVAELATMSGSEPWRVRVTERGEAAVLGPWRAHLRDCAVFGLWCAPARVPVIITDLLEVASAQGFERLLGPLVPERDARPYLDAGLRVVSRVVVMRAAISKGAAAPTAPAGLIIRPADVADLPRIIALDEECFEPFWHYDATSLTRLVDAERVVVAEVDGRIVGYTLCTLRAGQGSLGRLAVARAYRRRGIGRYLVAEALAWQAARGARTVVLSTQEENAASRSLYASAGFRETGDVLVACASGNLLDTSGDKAVDRCVDA